MKRATRQKQLKNAAVEAALSALHGKSKDKPALTGPRAVATGAVLYTAGRAAFEGRRFLRDQFSQGQAEDGGRESDEGSADAEPAEPRADAARGPSARRATRRTGPQPSLDLPRQRWPRMSASRR